MKKQNFLIKLHKKKKILIINPNQNVYYAYIQRSNESLESSRILFLSDNLRDSVSLAYYAMYHCLIGLLFRVGIKCENHLGSIILLKELFDLDNNLILMAKKERVDKQYYVDFEITKEEVKNSISIAEDFILFIIDSKNIISF